jgi:hypothetical protein
MDPEPSLDLGYGTGTHHLPMTAVGGDLSTMADLAAKVTVATLLDRVGYREHQIPGDHAILALRGAPGLAAPFDAPHAGSLRWRDTASPRPGCPSCATA